MKTVQDEWRRKAFHLAGLWMPIGYWFVDRRTAILVLCSLTFGCLLTEYLRLNFRRVNRLFVRIFGTMLRYNEHRDLTGLSSYLIGALLVVLVTYRFIAVKLIGAPPR